MREEGEEGGEEGVGKREKNSTPFLLPLRWWWGGGEEGGDRISDDVFEV